MAKNRSVPSALEFITGSIEETQAFGERLGQVLRPGDVVALYGELGSGKTTLLQGLARGLGRDPNAVKSPTFVLMREYAGEVPLVHIDGYRLSGAPAVSWLDLDLVFAPHKITVIEWADRFAGLLPDDYLELRLAHLSTNRRRIGLSASGLRGRELLVQMKASQPEAERCVAEPPSASSGALAAPPDP